MALISAAFQDNIFQDNVFQDNEFGDYPFQKNAFQNNVFDVRPMVIKLLNETLDTVITTSTNVICICR